MNTNNTMQNDMKDKEDVDNVVITKLKVANVMHINIHFQLILKTMKWKYQ